MPSRPGRLDELIRALLAASGDTVVVATVKTFQPWGDIRSYATRMFENGGRGIGQKGKDNGLLVLLAVDDRQVWVEVGYDLEGAVTDGFAGETSRQVMAPYFRQGDYGAGLLAGTSRIVERIAADRNVTVTGVRVPEPARSGARPGVARRPPADLHRAVRGAADHSTGARGGRRRRGWRGGVGPWGGGYYGGDWGGGSSWGGSSVGRVRRVRRRPQRRWWRRRLVVGQAACSATWEESCGSILTAGLMLMAATMASGCSYNRFVSQEEAVKAQWAQVENQLKRRSDLIPNLVETTKGFAQQERDVFEAIANSRAKLAGARTPQETMQAANEQSSALSRLLVVAENYPELRSSEIFARLTDELAGTENRIATERMRYNERVQEYNTSRRQFPANITNAIFRFQDYPLFEAPGLGPGSPEGGLFPAEDRSVGPGSAAGLPTLGRVPHPMGNGADAWTAA